MLTSGDIIWWPAAPGDLSDTGLERGMAILQHELQHVLDYRTGWLTAARYLGDPRHWVYGFDVTRGRWEALGAEQRASAAETFWLMERGFVPSDGLSALKRMIPWA